MAVRAPLVGWLKKVEARHNVRLGRPGDFDLSLNVNHDDGRNALSVTSMKSGYSAFTINGKLGRREGSDAALAIKYENSHTTFVADGLARYGEETWSAGAEYSVTPAEGILSAEVKAGHLGNAAVNLKSTSDSEVHLDARAAVGEMFVFGTVGLGWSPRAPKLKAKVGCHEGDVDLAVVGKRGFDPAGAIAHGLESHIQITYRDLIGSDDVYRHDLSGAFKMSRSIEASLEGNVSTNGAAWRGFTLKTNLGGRKGEASFRTFKNYKNRTPKKPVEIVFGYDIGSSALLLKFDARSSTDLFRRTSILVEGTRGSSLDSDENSFEGHVKATYIRGDDTFHTFETKRKAAI